MSGTQMPLLHRLRLLHPLRQRLPLPQRPGLGLRQLRSLRQEGLHLPQHWAVLVRARWHALPGRKLARHQAMRDAQHS